MSLRILFSWSVYTLSNADISTVSEAEALWFAFYNFFNFLRLLADRDKIAELAKNWDTDYTAFLLYIFHIHYAWFE